VIDYCELSSIIFLQQRFDVLENLKFLQHDQKINAVHLEERERQNLLSPAGGESQKRLLIVVMMRLSVGLTSTP
jgi:hypothetical protein